MSIGNLSNILFSSLEEIERINKSVDCSKSALARFPDYYAENRSDEAFQEYLERWATANPLPDHIEPVEMEEELPF